MNTQTYSGGVTDHSRQARIVEGLGLLLVALCMSPAAADEPPRKAGDVVIERVPGEVEFELGTLHVPENRSDPDSRIIGVGFARFRGRPGADSPPVFLLPGGPGSSYVNGLKPGSSRLRAMLEKVRPLQAVGDVVLVDQRGFSERGEVLEHRYRTPEEPSDRPGTLERSSAAFAEMARAAVAEFAERGIDLRGYTVKECADDVDDLRKALGYDQISLMGGSFGSQWSFAIMRRHPDRVARALLAGVEPLDCGYDMPSHIMAAVRRMWWEAEHDPRFKPYLPPGGLMAAAKEVLERLRREPIRVTLTGITDAKTGEKVGIVLGHEDFQWALGRMLRGTDGPAFVLSVYHGHYGRWAFETNFARRSRPAEIPVITPLIDTSLGVTPRRRYLLRTDPASELLGRWNFDSYMKTEEIWPSPDVGDEFRTESVCKIPVVFVHGDWDTQTPVENTLAIAPYFPEGHVLLVERGGHGVMGQLDEHLPETMASLMGFLKSGDVTVLPTRVTVPAPKFSVPTYSPPK